MRKRALAVALTIRAALAFTYHHAAPRILVSDETFSSTVCAGTCNGHLLSLTSSDELGFSRTRQMASELGQTSQYHMPSSRTAMG